jgi:hypothetical protein
MMLLLLFLTISQINAASMVIRKVNNTIIPQSTLLNKLASSPSSIASSSSSTPSASEVTSDIAHVSTTSPISPLNKITTNGSPPPPVDFDKQKYHYLALAEQQFWNEGEQKITPENAKRRLLIEKYGRRHRRDDDNAYYYEDSGAWVRRKHKWGRRPIVTEINESYDFDDYEEEEEEEFSRHEIDEMMKKMDREYKHKIAAAAKKVISDKKDFLRRQKIHHLALAEEKERHHLALTKEKERIHHLALAKEKERLKIHHLALAKEKERVHNLALARLLDEKENEEDEERLLDEKEDEEDEEKKTYCFEPWPKSPHPKHSYYNTLARENRPGT